MREKCLQSDSEVAVCRTGNSVIATTSVYFFGLQYAFSPLDGAKSYSLGL